MKACAYLYLNLFFLEWEVFRTKVVDKIKSHILCSVTFFRKSRHLCDNVEEYVTSGQATHDNVIRRISFACRITKATGTRSEYVIIVAFPRRHGETGYANAYQYYDYIYIACLLDIFTTALLRVLFVLYIGLNNVDI